MKYLLIILIFACLFQLFEMRLKLHKIKKLGDDEFDSCNFGCWGWSMSCLTKDDESGKKWCIYLKDQGKECKKYSIENDCKSGNECTYILRERKYICVKKEKKSTKHHYSLK
jgi:hypothetical protein